MDIPQKKSSCGKVRMEDMKNEEIMKYEKAVVLREKIIEAKYKKSESNHRYVFPRKEQSTSNSFSSEGSDLPNPYCLNHQNHDLQTQTSGQYSEEGKQKLPKSTDKINSQQNPSEE